MADQELDITLEEENSLDIDLESGIIEVPTGDIVHVATTAVWNSTPTLIAKAKHIYVYSDYADFGIPGIKIGDGTTYLIDLPFVEGNDSRLNSHIYNEIIHVTSAERAFWNNKVTCYISPTDSEQLVFSKDAEEG